MARTKSLPTGAAIATVRWTAARAESGTDGLEALERLRMIARAEEDISDEVSDLAARLQAAATPELLPGMFGALEDSDPFGVWWAVFYILEDQDDGYLAGLLDALPSLLERAPGWAETAVIRILNTAGEPDDCTDQFLDLARDRPAEVRRALVQVLRNMQAQDDALTDLQRETIERAVARAR